MVPITALAVRRILIVEDDGIIAEHLRHILVKAGHEVAGIAASSDEVFANVEERHPDLILMDIHIDGPLDGIETAEKLQETSNIPLIFLSAYSDAKTRSRVNAGKVREFLHKPVNQSKLLKAIDDVIGRAQ